MYANQETKHVHWAGRSRTRCASLELDRWTLEALQTESDCSVSCVFRYNSGTRIQDDLLTQYNWCAQKKSVQMQWIQCIQRVPASAAIKEPSRVISEMCLLVKANCPDRYGVASPPSFVPGRPRAASHTGETRDTTPPIRDWNPMSSHIFDTGLQYKKPNLVTAPGRVDDLWMCCIPTDWGDTHDPMRPGGGVWHQKPSFQSKPMSEAFVTFEKYITSLHFTWKLHQKPSIHSKATAEAFLSLENYIRSLSLTRKLHLKP
jgi:hypothetical protein